MRFRKAVSTCLAMMALLLPPVRTAAQTEAWRQAVEEGRKSVHSLMTETGIPGLSVAVGVDGKVVWAEGFGLADLELRSPVTPRTRFRLGSVSKMLTIAAVARLHEQGKLDLDAPIAKYIPSFPDKGQPITARQLTGHLGGIRHYQAKDYTGGRNIDFMHFDDVESSLGVFRDDPLIAPPGTRYFYSTFGYTLLSRVVEAAAGRSFLDLLGVEVFSPIGMTSTMADRPEEIIPDRTRFYEKNRDGRIINAPFVDSSYKWAGGGILSTASELILFGSAHLGGGFLKAGTLEMMFTSQRTADGRETGVGLGWRIGRDSTGRRILHHAGSINGGRALIMIYPDSRLTVALLSNLGRNPAEVEKEGQKLAGPFLELIDSRNSNK